VLIELTAPPATQQRERAPVNLAYRDRFSIVVYDDRTDRAIDATADVALHTVRDHLLGETLVR
jgi:hypothetical protein